MQETLIIAYRHGVPGSENGWYVVRVEGHLVDSHWSTLKYEVVSGPTTHENAVRDIETRAYRIKQGWQP